MLIYGAQGDRREDLTSTYLSLRQLVDVKIIGFTAL